MNRLWPRLPRLRLVRWASHDAFARAELYVVASNDAAADAARRAAADKAAAAARARKNSFRSTGDEKCMAINRYIAAAQNASDVFAVFDQRGHDFSPLNLATALYRAGALASSYDIEKAPFLEDLVQRATESIRDDPSQWETRGLAHACWGAAAVGADASALLEAASTVALTKMADFKPQELANIVWAFARARFQGPLLFEAVSAEALTCMESFNAQSLANTAWAYSTVGFEAPFLYDAIASQAEAKIKTMKAQEMAQLVWAFAKAGVKAPLLFEAVARGIPAKVSNFTPQHLSETAWAYAILGVRAPFLFHALAAQVLQKSCRRKKVHSFTPMDLSSIVWAFARLGLEAPALFQAVAVEATKKIFDFTPSDLGNIVWAYAQTRVKPPLLFQAVAAEAPWKMCEFAPNDLANTVWAFATLGMAPPDLFEAAAERAAHNIGDFDPQSLAKTAWAFATASFPAPALLEVVAVEVRLKMGLFSESNLCQLHQVLTLLRAFAPDHPATLSLAEHASDLSNAAARAVPPTLKSMRNISAKLVQMEWHHNFEFTTPEGISIDMAQPKNKVALEFDGPTRYLRGLGADGKFTRGGLDGRALAKDRLLRSLGWRVLHVPYLEWDALRRNPDQDSYLWRKTAEEETPHEDLADSKAEAISKRSRRRSEDPASFRHSQRGKEKEWDDGGSPKKAAPKGWHPSSDGGVQKKSKRDKPLTASTLKKKAKAKKAAKMYRTGEVGENRGFE